MSDAQDITETLKAIKTAQQLAEDYEQIFANAAIPIVQIDLDGKVSHVFGGGHVFRHLAPSCYAAAYADVCSRCEYADVC